MIHSGPVMSRMEGDDQRTRRDAGSFDFDPIDSQDPFPLGQRIPDLGGIGADLRERPVEIHEVARRTLPGMPRDLGSRYVGVVERLGEAEPGQAAFCRLVLRGPHEQVHILV